MSDSVTLGVGPQLAGYLYQFELALYRLISSSDYDIQVGIETDDDVVAMSFENGKLQFEFNQAKHTVQGDKQPIADRSRNLWHTLHIWLDLLSKHQGQPGNLRFQFITNVNVPANSLVQRLSEAESEDEITVALSELRTVGSTVTGKAAESAKSVLNYPETSLRQLIAAISIQDKSLGADSAALVAKTIGLFQLSKSLRPLGKQFYDSLLGLMVHLCAKAWRTGQPAVLAKEPFMSRLEAEVATHRRKRLYEQSWMSLSLQNYLKQDPSRFLFLKQLTRINVKGDAWHNALEHYWGFYTERARLTEAGDILPAHWDARNDELIQRWKQIANNHDDSDDSTVEVTARKIYTKTMSGEYHAQLGENRSTNWYFTAGNYHDLANGEHPKYFVHWHPEFKSNLEK